LIYRLSQERLRPLWLSRKPLAWCSFQCGSVRTQTLITEPTTKPTFTNAPDRVQHRKSFHPK